MKRFLTLSALALCLCASAQTRSTIAKWTFDHQYVVSNKVATPQEALQTSNGARNMHNVKIVADRYVGTKKMTLLPFRATKEGQVDSQDDKGAYIEVEGIACNGAALHMTSPVPTPKEPSNTFQWGDNEFSFPDGNLYSYQKPYNYYELELITKAYVDIKIDIKAAGHLSDCQYYAVAYSTDKASWTVVGDNYLTGSSYNVWTNNVIDLPVADLDKAYVRIFPAYNWKGCGNNVGQDNQFVLDEVAVTGMITVDKAEIASLKVNGVDATRTDDFVFESIIAETYNEPTTTIVLDRAHCTATAKCTDKNGEKTITKVDENTFTIETPEQNSSCQVVFTIAATDGAVVEDATYTLNIKHEGIVNIATMTINGENAPADLIAQINTPDAYAATLSGQLFTTVPAIEAVTLDGTACNVTYTLDGDKAIYALDAGKRTFTLNIEGVHAYIATEKDEELLINFTRAGLLDENTWSDGLYTLHSDRIDGWNNSNFKFNSADNRLELPSGIVVKQLILTNFSANYGNGEGLQEVKSEGATAYIPTKHQFKVGKYYDLAVTLVGHRPGAPIEFTLADIKKQPFASILLVLEKTNPGSTPVVMSADAAVSYNHAIVTVNFDREIQETTATVNGQTLTCAGGTSTHKYAVWGLEYDKTYTLTIAAGTAFDYFGNSNPEDINVEIAVPSHPTATKAAYDYVVSSVDEFKQALAEVNVSNKNADAPRKVIFLLNGDYNFGGEEQRFLCYNISLIGESRDGVVIRGTRNGISNPVLNLRDRSGFYLQDLTLRNDFNYGMEDKNTGQAVAVYGGNKTIMKNVLMLGNQDTQVTGDKAYFDKCEIHGTVDFICGGGDNFYDQCDLVLEDRGGNVVAAPNTDPALKYGYVFSHCTISPIKDAVFAVDGSYHLGRPWQQEPRIYYVYTKMNILPADNGWTSMGQLPTHFYEYGSVDKDGNEIDLSVRGNSPTSTNQYSPVLTKEEADFLTLENVIGMAEGWLPTDYTTLPAAPKVADNNGLLTWADNPLVRTTVIYKDGAYLANTSENAFVCPAPGEYVLRAANDMGGLSTESTTVIVENAGISGVVIDTAADAPAYNVIGLPVDASYKGIVIRNGRKYLQK